MPYLMRTGTGKRAGALDWSVPLLDRMPEPACGHSRPNGCNGPLGGIRASSAGGRQRQGERAADPPTACSRAAKRSVRGLPASSSCARGCPGLKCATACPDA